MDIPDKRIVLSVFQIRQNTCWVYLTHISSRTKRTKTRSNYCFTFRFKKSWQYANGCSVGSLKGHSTCPRDQITTPSVPCSRRTVRSQVKKAQTTTLHYARLRLPHNNWRERTATTQLAFVRSECIYQRNWYTALKLDTLRKLMGHSHGAVVWAKRAATYWNRNNHGVEG